MPLNGRYASSRTTSTITPRQRLAHHWFWLRHTITMRCARPHHLAPEDTGAGSTIYREWGHWTIRPVAGWRSHRWITPPLRATRAIPASNHDAATQWALDVLGI